MSANAPQISPVHFFDTVGGYQRSAALKAAVELGLFTAVAEGNETARAAAQKCGASERGTRILCDYLVIIGFMTKEGDRYKLTPDTAAFLDSRSPTYLGGAIEFLLSPLLMEAFSDMTETVRAGTTRLDSEGTLGAENPVWVKFARAMMPMMALPAKLMAEIIDPEANRPLKVLDIAAGHGIFGITLAQRNPRVEVTALDWPGVLEVAKENAARMGVSDRYKTLPGSALDVEFGGPYDLVLLTNFLHHFDEPTNENLLRKVRAALADGGSAATLEFVPNEDRVTPPASAGFSLTMLATTPSGDAYTFSQLDRMFRNAGYARNEIHQLPPSIQQLIVSYK
jgi:ubiquinone/menaquinone biosynthesis C-methylase UbiE